VLDLADFEHELRPLVQQADQLRVELVNLTAQRLEFVLHWMIRIWCGGVRLGRLPLLCRRDGGRYNDLFLHLLLGSLQCGGLQA